MQKNFFKLTFLMTMFGIMLTSCGGVNQSDPQSVAEAVMKCYSADDYKGIIQYVNPEDKHRIKNLEQMQEIADQMKGNGEENKTQPKEITFNEMSDGMMPDEKVAEFKYVKADGEVWTMRVMLEQKDGKWYCAGIK